MRLTLRTLLAYMDDILDPADHEDLGRKIEASDFASELIHRSRDTVRRLRLGAPAVTAGGGDDVLESNELADANSVAEYLDNTLPPEQVAEFERMCLEPGTEPDMHLAEVASCHHVLTMVLGEPAEIDSHLKAKMYELPSRQSSGAGSGQRSGQKLRIEPAHISPTATAEVAAAQPSAAPQSQPASTERQLPDYLREAAASGRRRRRRMVAAVLCIGVGGLGYWFATAPPAVAPEEIANIDIAAIEAGEIEMDGMEDLMADGTAAVGGEGTEAPPYEPAATSSESPETNSGVAPVDSSVVAEPEVTVSIGIDPTETAPVETAPSEPAQPVAQLSPEVPAEMPTEMKLPEADALANDLENPDADLVPAVTSAGETSPPLVPNFPGAQSVDTIIVEKLAAESSDKVLDDPLLAAVAGGTTRAEDTLVTPIDEPKSPSGPQRLGNYPGSDNRVLLLHDTESDKWLRMPPRTPIATGDTLLTLPKFRTQIVLADVNASLWGGTQLRLPVNNLSSSVNSKALNLDVVYGRMSLAAGLNGNDIVMQVGDQIREFNLAISAHLVVEVQRVFVPGSDYENTAAPIRATWYLIEGSAEWPTAGGGVQTVQSPATWQTIDGIDEIPEQVVQLPEWIDSEPMTDTEREARDNLDTELQAGEPVGIRLLELTDGKGLGRRSEVRILAAASSVFVGEFEPLVKALGDKKQKRAWKTHISELRQALALSPSVAKHVRRAFVNIRGEEAANDLMEMVIGYGPEQIGNTPEEIRAGDLAKVIKWLDHSHLDYRVLAIHNIREITKKWKGYHPDSSAKRRNIDYRKIWKAFEANELMPKS